MRRPPLARIRLQSRSAGQLCLACVAIGVRLQARNEALSPLMAAELAGLLGSLLIGAAQDPLALSRA
jgi:hypothetical protein